MTFELILNPYAEEIVDLDIRNSAQHSYFPFYVQFSNDAISAFGFHLPTRDYRVTIA